MKTPVTVFYQTNKKTGEVITVESITDCYSEVQVYFRAEDVTVEDIKALSFSDTWKKEWIGKLVVDGFFCMQEEAKDIPSIGNIVCGTQTVEVEIDKNTLGDK